MLAFRRQSPLVWILVLALGVRVGAACVLQYWLDHVAQRPFLIAGDAEGYWDLGRHLAHGEPFRIYDPPRRVLRMPGYPALVATAVRLAERLRVPQYEHFIGRLLLAATGTLACGLTAVLGRQLFDARTGLIAAAIAAFAPPLVAFSVILLSETLFAAALLLSLCCMAGLVKEAARGAPFVQLAAWACLSGLAIGLAVYVRPSWLLYSVCFGAALLVGFRGTPPLRQRVALAALVVGCAYASLLPWAHRNRQLTGHWVMTTLWVGPSLYDSFNPQTRGASDMQFFEADPLTKGMDEYEIDRYYRDKAWDFVRANPLRALELAAIKAWRFWKPWPNAEQFGGLGARFLVAAYFGPLLITAAIGWLSAPRRFWPWLLAWGPILYFAAIHMVFLGSLRYRLPAEYPLCIASAFGLQRLSERIFPGS